jgi:hypothetical protein
MQQMGRKGRGVAGLRAPPGQHCPRTTAMWWPRPEHGQDGARHTGAGAGGVGKVELGGSGFAGGPGREARGPVRKEKPFLFIFQ